MLTIKEFCFNAFQENTFVVYNEKKQAIIVDPGCYTRIEQKILTDFIVQHSLTPSLLLNTHCHLEHVFGNNFISETYGLSALLHPNEQVVLNRLPESAAKWGVPAEAYKGPIQYIHDQEIISFDDEKLMPVSLADTRHYQITSGILNNPESYWKHLRNSGGE